MFREGQAMQVLDTLFFDFIDLAKELQPKVVIAENVKGLLLGNAKSYVIEIYKQFDKAGYHVQHFLLDASKMGVPQRRERVFFIALRKDLSDQFMERKDMFTMSPKLEMVFNERPITFKEIFHDYTDRPLSENGMMYWNERKKGDSDFSFASGRLGKNENAMFQHKYLYMNKVNNTILAGDQCVLFDYPRYRNFDELCESGSYPKDYEFNDLKVQYLIGMSVPPVMTAQVASNVYDQWLSKL